jgi:hypothetical protein
MGGDCRRKGVFPRNGAGMQQYAAGTACDFRR